jgi:hypothetical protein
LYPTEKNNNSLSYQLNQIMISYDLFEMERSTAFASVLKLVPAAHGEAAVDLFSFWIVIKSLVPNKSKKSLGSNSV